MLDAFSARYWELCRREAAWSELLGAALARRERDHRLIDYNGGRYERARRRRADHAAGVAR